MSCFPCFSAQRSRKCSKNENGSQSKTNCSSELKSTVNKNKASSASKEHSRGEERNLNAQTFTFRELATATKNFRQECLLGEGGFGRVYKGTLQASGQVVAVKQLDRNGLQGNKEFLAEISMLSLLHHPNLVNLIGYCADGEQRLLVYEFMSAGSLEDRLLEIEPKQKPLDWYTRIKIAFGAATGLEYLHEKADPPVVYRDLKSSNILLDEDLNPKLSDFGQANLGPSGEKVNVSSRVMGTYGYCAPEYTRCGTLTLKSDIYSFGVVLLELITGRKAMDTTRPNDEQNLVAWAQPFFRDPKKFPDLADPLLNRQFPEKDLNQVVAIAAMCLQEEASARPLISDVVTTLSFLSTTPSESFPAPPPANTSDEISEKDYSKGSKHLDASTESHDFEKKNSRDESHDGSDSSRSNSSRGSKSIRLIASLSKMSSRKSSDHGSSASSKHKNRNDSLEKVESLGSSSSKASRNGSFSLSLRSSRGSQKEKLEFSRNSSETVYHDHKNSMGSHGESVYYDHKNSMGSQDDVDGSFHSS
ncbi:hypothetical protein UlMin_029938 [Ulmus minor]